MPIASKTLNTIQKLGAAAFVAAEQLKKEVANYGDRVNAAIAKNPFDLGNDSLIDHWKVIARLSKTLSGIEDELKNVFRVASSLTGDDLPSDRGTLAIAAPVVATAVPVKKRAYNRAVQPVTTVTVKPKKKPADALATTALDAPVKAVPAKRATKKTATPDTSKAKKTAPVAKTSAPAKKAPTKPVAKVTPKRPKSVTPTGELKGNAAKLMTHLQGLLNVNDFTEINQSSIAQQTGIALGSMAATTNRLIASGQIITDSKGGFKLSAVQPVAAANSQAQPESDPS